MNKRKTPRVNFKIQADAQQTENHYTGDVQNLSLSGFFFKTSHQFSQEETIIINISLNEEASHTITAKGKVVRVTPDGVGIEFEEMDIDSFEQLKNIIVYNDNNPEETDYLVEDYIKKRAT